MDLGANLHVVNDEKYFDTLYRFYSKVKTAEASASLAVHGGGTVIVFLVAPDGRLTKVKLTDVVYAPSATCNLLSLSRLAERANLTGVWNGDRLTIVDLAGQHIGYAVLRGGLYHL